MKRLRPFDKALLTILIPLWAVGFTLSIKSALRPTAIPAVYVSAPAHAEDYPTVAGFRPDVSVEDPGLRVGDRVLRVGDTDLRGVGPMRFFVRVAQESGEDRGIVVAFERAGKRGETTLPVGSYGYFVWPVLPVSFVFVLAAVLLLIGAPQSPMVRALFQAFMCTAITFAAVFGDSPLETYTSIAINSFSMALSAPLVIRALLLFPHDVRPTGRWARAGPWLFIAYAPVTASALYGFPLSPAVGLVIYAALSVATIVTCLLVAGHAYRRADSIGRRQLKWFIFGVYSAGAPPLAAHAVAAVDPRFTAVAFLSLSALALLPISLLISVVRYNLFDIDRLISATASYNILLILLVAAALLVVPRVADAASGLIGIDPSTGQIGLSLLLAAVVVPAHRRLRPQIDRLFFSERHTVDQGVEQLLRELSECTHPKALTRHTGDSLYRLLRPEACVIYGRSEHTYAPMFAEGRAVPPAFERESPLVATLRWRQGPLSLSQAGRRADAAAVSPFDRAALDTLGAEVVVPVRRRDELLAFLCLGPKRSGDVYTSTDLTLLSAVAEKVSTELLRFDDAEIIQQGRTMQEALRRYVPGAVAEQLRNGHDLEEAGEREVSVLFVDIRGYTAYSESRGAQQIFSTVNQYTKTVSEIVRKYGGSVVEFNGDGMMAVFGAPAELAAKERAAVNAGREVFAAVEGLPLQAEGGVDTKLSVGVGIATGKDFVGNIRAADRMIWTTIGNTTNLAARLQSLTRDLNAAVVIDEPTRRASGGAAAGFKPHESVPIRGRRERENVYVLGLPA